MYKLIYMDSFSSFNLAGDNVADAYINAVAIEKLQKKFEHIKILRVDTDGWIDAEITINLKAKTHKGMIKEVEKLLALGDRQIDCYNIVDHKGNLIEVEGGIYQEEKS
jgi:hypothetical protein